jgi:O-acetyl-ADP-ribose deacetylase (regulator of RNase III)
MRASIFIGDIAEVEADAVCTSTNPRLSLMMGTGAAVRSRGGYEILRECEAIVRREGPLPPGSAWQTTAGSLGSKVVIHCVASDGMHRSSEGTVGSCVRQALGIAGRAGCRTIAMPVLATGHAHMNFRRALEVMREAARDSQAEIIFVLRDEDDLDAAREVLGRNVRVTRCEAEAASAWGDENPFG